MRGCARTSKAALNMAVAAAQHNYPGATLVTIDPGWVQTDMGGGTAPLTVEDSVRGLRSTLASVTPADKGRLLHHDGRRAAHWSGPLHHEQQLWRQPMLLTQDQEMIRDAVRDFAQTELWPHAARWDKEHHFPKEAHQGLAALGAYGICVPEEFGGANLDYRDAGAGAGRDCRR